MRAWRPGVCLSTGMLPLRCAGLAKCTTGGAWLATLTSRSTLAHSTFPPLSVCELLHSLLSCKLIARSCAEQSLQGTAPYVCLQHNGLLHHWQRQTPSSLVLHACCSGDKPSVLLMRSSDCGITLPASAISIPSLTRAPACTQCSTLRNITCLA